MDVRTVLVTGASGALGKRVTERFLAAGCQVIGTYLAGTREELHHRKDVAWLEMDVTDSRSIRAGLASLKSGEFEIDALIHCAGGFRYLPMDSANDEDIDFLLNVNLKSAMLMTREVLQGMKTRSFGRIVLVSSRATLAPTAGMGPYAASKAGLNALVAAVADEVRAHDININAVLPTVIDTPANRRDMPNADHGAWVTPESLAEIVFQLTQPFGKPLNGALIPVAGRL